MLEDTNTKGGPDPIKERSQVRVSRLLRPVRSVQSSFSDRHEQAAAHPASAAEALLLELQRVPGREAGDTQGVADHPTVPHPEHPAFRLADVGGAGRRDE